MKKNTVPVYRITCEKPLLKGVIALPGSKSISNRVLMIEAISGETIKKQNLSTSNDTVKLAKALNNVSNEIQTGEGGTTFRFLLSYLAMKKGEWTLQSNGTMNKRPVGELADALKKLGAKIDYLGKEGFPPLKITGGKLKGGKVSVRSDISSQFISSLLLIAPYLPKGLELTMTGKSVSASYIEMTTALMNHFGIDVEKLKNKLVVKPGKYTCNPIRIESDWSAASYWYELAALCEQGELMLKGLTKTSLQGDAVVADMFQPMHVATTYKNNQVQLTKFSEKQLSLFEGDETQRSFSFNLSSTPDLFPALIVLSAARGWNVSFSGVEHLAIKESNRIDAFRKELKKMGVTMEEANGTYTIKGKIKPGNYTIDTYNDHRIAMAFAPLSIILGKIDIQNPEVVGKSYPGYWDDLAEFGLKIIKL